MPIYYGGNKISEVYKDGASIKEVYNGSDLVFKKNTGIQCFFGSKDWISYVLGEYKVGSYVIAMYPSTDGFSSQISSITGTLGKSGSKVTANYKNYNNSVTSEAVPYLDTIVVCGKNFHRYGVDNYYTQTCFLVEDGSVVGNYVLYSSRWSKDTVYSVSSNSFTCNYNTGLSFTRNASKDIFWSKELGFFKP